jgi:hypothetical protein
LRRQNLLYIPTTLLEYEKSNINRFFIFNKTEGALSALADIKDLLLGAFFCKEVGTGTCFLSVSEYQHHFSVKERVSTQLFCKGTSIDIFLLSRSEFRHIFVKV